VARRNEYGFLKRISIDIAGFGLIFLGLLTGWLPGPGGIPLTLAGLALLALNYEWAENILKNFDKKRIELTKKYLQADPPVSYIIDILCFIIFGLGAWLLTQDMLIFRGIGFGMVIFSILTLLSNQQRIDRLIARFKKNKR
jgi:hypothetical protein